MIIIIGIVYNEINIYIDDVMNGQIFPYNYDMIWYNYYKLLVIIDYLDYGQYHFLFFFLLLFKSTIFRLSLDLEILDLDLFFFFNCL